MLQSAAIEVDRDLVIRYPARARQYAQPSVMLPTTRALLESLEVELALEVRADQAAARSRTD